MMKTLQTTVMRAIVLSLALVVLGACGSGSDETVATPEPTPASEVAPTPEPTAVPEPTDVPEPTAVPEPDVATDEDAPAESTDDATAAPSDTGSDLDAGQLEGLEFLLAFAMGVPEEDLPEAVDCVMSQLNDAGIDFATAFDSPTGGAISLASVRCVDDAAAFMFGPEALAGDDILNADEAQCAADTFIEVLRAVPLDEADAFMASDEPPPELVEQVQVTCGLDAEQVRSLVDG